MSEFLNNEPRKAVHVFRSLKHQRYNKLIMNINIAAFKLGKGTAVCSASWKKQTSWLRPINRY